MNAKRFSVWSIIQASAALAMLLGAVATPSSTRAQSAASITIAPTSGPPGSQALVTGSGFTGGYTASIYWGSTQGRYIGSSPVKLDGSFDAVVRIPPEATSGLHTVVANAYPYISATATFNVTQADRSAAYIYNTDITSANSFKNLLDGNGINTTLVQLQNVASTSLYGYDVILVGHDTGTGGDWSGSATARGRIQDLGKPVIGLGRGGASLFEELNLYIRSGNCWTTSNKTQVYAYDDQHPIWNVPYRISIPGDHLVTIYSQSTSARAVYMPNPVDGVLALGRQDNNDTHYPLIEEDGLYLLWGFYDGPASMSSTGEDLFVNVVWYLVRALEVDTLILTDYDRMENLGYSHADVVALENSINNLKGLSSDTTNMTAVHKDVSDDAPPEVQTACGGWDGNEGDVSATNTCVEAIDDYIESLKQASYPHLAYLILVGANEVIPAKAREQDHLFTSQEKNFGNGLPGTRSYLHDLYSTPGTNGWGHYLTDSIYGDLSYVDDGWGADHELIPELAVGRLVETPPQIVDLIDTYIADEARFYREQRLSMASDGLLDAGDLAATYMGPGTDDDLCQESYDSNDVPPRLNTTNDLVYFTGHGYYNSLSTGGESFKAGNHATYGDTHDLSDLPGAAIVSHGCHVGVSFGNMLYHAPDGTTTYAEFPEEFASKRVGIFVGHTGLGAGCVSGPWAGVCYNEKLSSYIVYHIMQDGSTTAGEAFKQAVDSYMADVGAMGSVHRRVLGVTTLYGIPNYQASSLVFLPWPWLDEYWLEPLWLDPPPYLDPGPIHFQVILELLDWEILVPGPGPEWYLAIPGASYEVSLGSPLLPVLKAGNVLPPGSTIADVEWDQAASQSTTWTADAPMYIPAGADVGSEVGVRGTFEAKGLYPSQPHAPYTTTTKGGEGMVLGIRMVPLQHDPQTLETTLWTRLVYTVTYQAAASTDADGDTLPTYWEASLGLDPNDATGDDGASGDPDNDNLTNDQEFGRGANPRDPDTDDDGWSDGDEAAWTTDPLNPGSHPSRVLLPLVLKDYQ